METTKVKFIKELILKTLDDDTYEEENIFGLTVYECMKCHWRFTGDCGRSGYGYTHQEQQTPNYCPMCGIKIDDEFEEEV